VEAEGINRKRLEEKLFAERDFGLKNDFEGTAINMCDEPVSASLSPTVPQKSGLVIGSFLRLRDYNAGGRFLDADSTPSWVVLAHGAKPRHELEENTEDGKKFVSAQLLRFKHWRQSSSADLLVSDLSTCSARALKPNPKFPYPFCVHVIQLQASADVDRAADTEGGREATVGRQAGHENRNVLLQTASRVEQMKWLQILQQEINRG
jgi:hypothetical protein